MNCAAGVIATGGDAKRSPSIGEALLDVLEKKTGKSRANVALTRNNPKE